MRKNLIVISFDYALARRTAEILSDKFDRRFFDMFDMFASICPRHPDTDMNHLIKQIISAWEIFRRLLLATP